MALTYEPLAYSEFETRILEIVPDAADSPVRCKLSSMSLFNPPRYYALSYRWSSDIDEEVTVNDAVVPVSSTLKAALVTLRRKEIYTLWVDKLCINQEDKQEKSIQIRHMAGIYAKAEVTYSWLGAGSTSDFTPVGLSFLRVLALATDRERLIRSEHTHQQNTASSSDTAEPSLQDSCRGCIVDAGLRVLRYILQQDYWKRCWIIQEVSAAKEVQILCDCECISLEDMQTSKKAYELHKPVPSSSRTSQDWFKCIVRFRESYSSQRQLTLLEALKLSRGFEASEPRDAIFALLGLTADGAALVPTPNYFQSMESLMLDLTRQLLRRTKRLELIVQWSTEAREIEFDPRWAIDWLRVRLPENVPYGPLGGLCIQDNMPLGRDKVLQVTGINLGVVESITKPVITPDRSPEAEVAKQTPNISSNNHIGASYYKEISRVEMTLYDCFSGRLFNHEADQTSPDKYNFSYSEIKFGSRHLAWNSRRRRWRAFCLAFAQRSSHQVEGSAPIPLSDNGQPGMEIFRKWIEVNSGFMIESVSLAQWFSPHLRWYHSIRLDPRGFGYSIIALPVVAFAIFPFVPGIFFVVRVAYRQDIAVKWIVCCALVSLSVALMIVAFLLYSDYNGDKDLRDIKRRDAGKGCERQIQRILCSKHQLAKIGSGMLCLIYQQVQVGDTIFLLAGHQDPLVLRSVQKEDVHRSSYQIVGTAIAAFNTDESNYFRAFNAFRSNRPDPRSEELYLQNQQASLVRYLEDDRWTTVDVV